MILTLASSANVAARCVGRLSSVSAPAQTLFLPPAPVLGALGLRIDDHVSEEIIVPPRLLEIVAQRLGSLGAVLLEHLYAHALADQGRGKMVGRAPHVSAREGQLGRE